MMDGPHILGGSPVTSRISLTRAFASSRLVWSASWSINAATLTVVGLVLFSAILPPVLFMLLHDNCNSQSSLVVGTWEFWPVLSVSEPFPTSRVQVSLCTPQ